MLGLTAMTAEEWHTSRPLNLVSTNADGSLVTAAQADVMAAKVRERTFSRVIWGVAILGGGGLLLYALIRK